MRQRVARMVAVSAWTVIATLALGGCGAGSSGDDTAGAGGTVLVVGDEFSGGTERAWPQLLDSTPRLDTDIEDGSGYLTASPSSVRDRLSAVEGEGTIILALGAHDLDADAPEAITRSAVRDALTVAQASAGRVLVLPPLDPAASGSSRAAELEGILREESASAGAEYVEVELGPTGAAGAGAQSGLGSVGSQAVADAVEGRLR